MVRGRRWREGLLLLPLLGGAALAPPSSGQCQGDVVGLGANGGAALGGAAAAELLAAPSPRASRLGATCQRSHWRYREASPRGARGCGCSWALRLGALAVCAPRVQVPRSSASTASGVAARPRASPSKRRWASTTSRNAAGASVAPPSRREACGPNRREAPACGQRSS
ncbi:unnamed protein product [Prorocentrum cordatum]|uniref:Uncharacterized protein n=1 Tax=Prorocentrum cordatum TaxID=2364126 RepID=A0ABN9SMV1_9DINO|nr:unnamed protein product [Polarella glacialis]